ncbi:uncharacterized protein LOC143150329 [Ptiloglossa arizonensis]|uniref:uncharacterized protein LOC143150329 n=1 Tax=Ptiloglossa arizonensis TaxID=3350558 RepID=UPI003FA01A62
MALILSGGEKRDRSAVRGGETVDNAISSGFSKRARTVLEGGTTNAFNEHAHSPLDVHAFSFGPARHGESTASTSRAQRPSSSTSGSRPLLLLFLVEPRSQQTTDHGDQGGESSWRQQVLDGGVCFARPPPSPLLHHRSSERARIPGGTREDRARSSINIVSARRPLNFN